jgi:hypothetical protein
MGTVCSRNQAAYPVSSTVWSAIHPDLHDIHHVFSTTCRHWRQDPTGPPATLKAEKDRPSRIGPLPPSSGKLASFREVGSGPDWVRFAFLPAAWVG